jgi:hypothetical protein
VHLVRVVELEVDVLDDERPDVVAETVGVEVTLRACQYSTFPAAAYELPLSYCRMLTCAHLECKPRLDLVCEHIGDRLVEVDEDLHGQLGLDAALGDQIVQRVREGAAQTVCCQPACSMSLSQVRAQYLLRR